MHFCHCCYVLKFFFTGKILDEKILSVNGMFTAFDVIQKLRFIERIIVFFINVSDKRVLIS